MKKKSERRIITAIVTGIAAVVAFACGAVLTACNGGSSKILETPTNLQIADEYLTWDEVEDAKSYVVEINGEEYETQTNSLDVMEITNEPTTYKFTVFAVGDNEKIYDSDPSEEIEHTVFKPQNLVLKKLNDGTCEISATFSEEVRNSMTGKLIIPEYVGNNIIGAIAKNGFRQCSKITGIYIPDGIQSIGDAAFELCTSASRIRLPKGLQKISVNTFKGCTALKEITVPNDVKTIGGEAFGMCSSLKKIDLPAGLTRICTNAFRECRSLQSLVFPNTIKDFVEDYSPTWTYDCDSLNHIEIVGGENEEFKSDGNCIIRKKDNALVYGCNGSVIPDYVTEILREAFAYCRSVKEIKIPGSVRKIGWNAFFNCSNLRSVTFSEGLQTVMERAFECCESLESVYISSTVESWGEKFDGITHLDLSGTNVFPKCKSLSTITVSKDNPVYKSDGNCLIRKSDNALIEGCVKSVIPSYVTVIGKNAFCECEGLVEIIIPYGVTEIGEYAFAYCSNVRSIFIPNSVKVIKLYAFAYCCLASTVIPESVTSMDSFTDDCAYAVFKKPPIFDFSGSISHSGYVPECVLAYDENSYYPYVYSVKYSAVQYVMEDIYGLIAPQRKGYTFLGWTTKEGGSEVDYAVVTTNIKHKCDTRTCAIYDHVSENVSITYLKPDRENETVLYTVWQKND